MMWWDNNAGAGAWTLMILGVLAIWVLVALACVAIVRGTPYGRRQGSGSRDATQILDERLARGEIDIDEYQARRDALRAVR